MPDRSESSPGSNQRSGGYRPDIDGLRAIAVLSVLLFHAGFSTFRGGFSGVDIFFVISGYLIGGHIFAEESARTFTFGSFYKRRAKRILPALFVVLLATLCLGMLLLAPFELRGLATEAIAALLSASNIFYWHVAGYFATNADHRLLLMTWSLGVEEQFYILMPLLMVGVMRSGKRLRWVLLLLAIMSFAAACIQVAHHPDAAFYLLPGRAWELLAGVLAALAAARRSASKAWTEALGIGGVLLVVAPVFLLSASVPFPGVGALPSVAGTVMLLFAATSWTNRFMLSAPPLRYVGKISYSLYLWHWPLLALATVVFDVRPSRLQALLLLAVAFVLAMASRRWIEQPFRRSSQPPRKLLLRYAAVTALLIGGCLFLRQSNGLRFGRPALGDEAELEDQSVFACQVTDPASRPVVSAQCIENTGKPAVAIWGDSHAGALATALRAKAHEQGYDFVQFTKTSCPPLQSMGRYFPSLPTHATECIDYNNDVVRRLVADAHVRIVVLAGAWSFSLWEPDSDGKGWLVADQSRQDLKPSREASATLLSTGLERTMRTLQAAGKQVVLTQDVPMLADDPAWRWRSMHLPVRRWVLSKLRPGQPVDPGFDAQQHLEDDRQARDLVAAAAASTAATLFDLEKPLCATRNRCQYSRDGTMLFLDNQHVSLAGAESILAGLDLPRSSVSPYLAPKQSSLPPPAFRH